MELWLRLRNGEIIEADEKIFVQSQMEWQEIIYDPRYVSSILWPTDNLFQLNLKHTGRKHHHEIDYANLPERNASYLNGCKYLAQQLEMRYGGSRCLVYAPLRGALPIWRGINQFITSVDTVVYYPVTSSFIFYPKELGILGNKGRPASGRYNNRLELERLLPFLEDFDSFWYVDEIVSGSMMRGHLKDMFRLKMEKMIPIVAIGLADDHGSRSVSKRLAFETYVQNSRLDAFLWAGCSSLITEDQKFLLGAHYVDYQLGPHVVPLLKDDLSFYPEKILFDTQVYSEVDSRHYDPFCARGLELGESLANGEK